MEARPSIGAAAGADSGCAVVSSHAHVGYRASKQRRRAAVGAALLDDVTKWFGRFIAVTNPDDLYLFGLWPVHTYLVNELYTTPRLLIDSIMPSSGKTTVLDHLHRLCYGAVQAANLTSPALIPRLLEDRKQVTILLDEADRNLRPDRPGVEDLIGILNSGYRSGATRPVLVQRGNGWEAREMPTFAPVAMAGNSPHLPLDTLTRSIRVLLMPDFEGTVEDSDWELIEAEAGELKNGSATGPRRSAKTSRAWPSICPRVASVGHGRNGVR